MDRKIEPEVVRKINFNKVTSYIKNGKIYLNLHGEGETYAKYFSIEICGIDIGIDLNNGISQIFLEHRFRFPCEKIIYLPNGKYPFEHFSIIYTGDKIEEVTMADIEKKFGCKVKIVGE